jgi:ribose transport system permease protein
VTDLQVKEETNSGSTVNPATRGTTKGRTVSIVRSQSFLIVTVLATILLIFAILEPGKFAQPSNLRLVAQNASILLVIGVGATFVIITGGIDLSVGSVVVFSGVISSMTMRAMGGQGWGTALVGVAVAIACGAGWGLVNGLLVAVAKLPAMIVTLGTLGMALGLAQVITGGVDIRGVPDVLSDNIGYGHVLGVPDLVIVASAVAVLGIILLGASRFGVYTRAVGSNIEGARRFGVNTTLHLIKVYVFAGACAGLAGILSVAQFSTTAIAAQSQTPLNVIVAVVIGGTSLFGGIGSVFGTVIGVLIPAVVQNGFIITGVEPFWQPVATGCVLILAVYADHTRRSRSG